MIKAFVILFWASTAWSVAIPSVLREKLNPLWDSGVRALQEKEHEQAERFLSSFIEEATKADVHSSEAYYNLGLAEWSLKKPGKAVFHLLQSARLRSSPLSSLKALATVSQLEGELGIRDRLSEAFTFRLYFLLNPDWLLALTSLGLWLLVGGLLARWLMGENGKAPSHVAMVLAAGLWLLAATGFVNRQLVDFAVLNGTRTSIPLYKNSREQTDEKLLDLPAGMIVRYGKKERGYVRVLQPVGGWVPEDGVHPVSVPN